MPGIVRFAGDHSKADADILLVFRARIAPRGLRAVNGEAGRIAVRMARLPCISDDELPQRPVPVAACRS
jgi:hypothetical protein